MIGELFIIALPKFCFESSFNGEEILTKYLTPRFNLTF